MQALLRRPDHGYLGNWLWVPKGRIDAEGMKNALALRFVDPHSETKIRYVNLYRETENHLLVPRCLWNPSNMTFPVVDVRPTEYRRVGFTSRIKLDHRMVNGQLQPTGEDVQQMAMEALLKAESGVLQLGCGKGKTVLALHLAAQLDGPTLILLDNTNLLAQWADDIEQFLDVPGGVGRIAGGVCDWKGRGIVLATYHSVGALALDMPEEMRREFRLIIYDEGHHISAATFAPAAECFYGYRLALTATAIRDDGLHIIYDNHVGPTIYKDITHLIKPRIVFKWTGLRLDATADAYSRNGEVHLSKVSTHFGKWRRRMSLILDDVEAAVSYGRKVLVLCNSVDETVNLCALWTMQTWRNPPAGNLYTDVPVPSMMEVGGDVPPVPLEPEQRLFAESEIARIANLISKGRATPELMKMQAEFELQLRQDDVHKRVTSELNRRQKTYRNWLTKNLTDSGLMIHKVDPQSRMEYIRTKRVVFGIIKYGKEGLDDEYLDTVLVSTPFSSRNGLQQLMGRPTRQKPGKKSPLVLFYEDDIGPLIGMCKKLRSHLSAWPIDENGPFDFEMHDHPRSIGRGYRPIFEDLKAAA
jgi:superfamily II DNA or RNA helicase